MSRRFTKLAAKSRSSDHKLFMEIGEAGDGQVNNRGHVVPIEDSIVSVKTYLNDPQW